MKKEITITAGVFILIIFMAVSGFSRGLNFEPSEYSTRRSKLMEMIPDGIAILQGSLHATGYTEYFQNNDFMYFTGVEIPNAVLIIDGIRKESLLFFTITKRSAAEEGISRELVRDPCAYTGIEKYYPKEQFSRILARLSTRSNVFYTPFTPEELIRECTMEKLNILRRDILQNEWDGRLTREQQFVKLLQERFPGNEVKDCSSLIWDLRIIKSPAEIALLRKVGQIGVEAHKAMMKATRPGMYEYEVAAVFDYMCKKAGARDLAYNVIISSAENHPYLHYFRHDRLLEKGDFLVVDAGPDYKYYDVDITVSYPADGKFTPRQREIYTACNEIEKACFKFYRPGVTPQEIGAQAKQYLIDQGIDLSTDVYQAMMRHLDRGGVTHFVGMAVHDVGGDTKEPLRPGMVIALDILAVFADEDMGVRVEDTVLITENGCENLTPGLPREIAEIERLMQQQGKAPQAAKANK